MLTLLTPSLYCAPGRLGLGETEAEIVQTMRDLRAANVDVLTLGQYLRPTEKHLAVVDYVTPEEFEHYGRIGKELGFRYVASGPMVRSSYKAGELFIAAMMDEDAEGEQQSGESVRGEERAESAEPTSEPQPEEPMPLPLPLKLPQPDWNPAYAATREARGSR